MNYSRHVSQVGVVGAALIAFKVPTYLFIVQSSSRKRAEHCRHHVLVHFQLVVSIRSSEMALT